MSETEKTAPGEEKIVEDIVDIMTIDDNDQVASLLTSEYTVEEREEEEGPALQSSSSSELSADEEEIQTLEKRTKSGWNGDSDEYHLKREKCEGKAERENFFSNEPTYFAEEDDKEIRGERDLNRRKKKILDEQASICDEDSTEGRSNGSEDKGRSSRRSTALNLPLSDSYTCHCCLKKYLRSEIGSISTPFPLMGDERAIFTCQHCTSPKSESGSANTSSLSSSSSINQAKFTFPDKRAWAEVAFIVLTNLALLNDGCASPIDGTFHHLQSSVVNIIYHNYDILCTGYSRNCWKSHLATALNTLPSHFEHSEGQQGRGWWRLRYQARYPTEEDLKAAAKPLTMAGTANWSRNRKTQNRVSDEEDPDFTPTELLPKGHKKRNSNDAGFHKHEKPAAHEKDPSRSPVAKRPHLRTPKAMALNPMDASFYKKQQWDPKESERRSGEENMRTSTYLAKNSSQMPRTLSSSTIYAIPSSYSSFLTGKNATTALSSAKSPNSSSVSSKRSQTHSSASDSTTPRYMAHKSRNERSNRVQSPPARSKPVSEIGKNQKAEHYQLSVPNLPSQRTYLVAPTFNSSISTTFNPANWSSDEQSRKLFYFEWQALFSLSSLEPVCYDYIRQEILRIGLRNLTPHRLREIREQCEAAVTLMRAATMAILDSPYSSLRAVYHSAVHQHGSIPHAYDYLGAYPIPWPSVPAEAELRNGAEPETAPVQRPATHPSTVGRIFFSQLRKKGPI